MAVRTRYIPPPISTPHPKHKSYTGYHILPYAQKGSSKMKNSIRFYSWGSPYTPFGCCCLPPLLNPASHRLQNATEQQALEVGKTGGWAEGTGGRWETAVGNGSQAEGSGDWREAVTGSGSWDEGTRVRRRRRQRGRHRRSAGISFHTKYLACSAEHTNKLASVTKKHEYWTSPHPYYPSCHTIRQVCNWPKMDSAATHWPQIYS